jgi:hypothetical protein
MHTLLLAYTTGYRRICSGHLYWLQRMLYGFLYYRLYRRIYIGLFIGYLDPILLSIETPRGIYVENNIEVWKYRTMNHLMDRLIKVCMV